MRTLQLRTLRRKVVKWAFHGILNGLVIVGIPGLIHLEWQHQRQLVLDQMRLETIIEKSEAEFGEIACLARNVFYEARSEPRDGQIKVAEVTLKRRADKRWPDSVCGVVCDKSPAPQFSWTLDHECIGDLPNGIGAADAIRIAFDAYDGKLMPLLPDCTRFYKRADNRNVSSNSRSFFATLAYAGQVSDEEHEFFC